MLRKLRPRSIYDVFALLALLVDVGGTSAYAANTIRSGDIIDNEITTTDVRDDTLGFGGLYAQDLAAGSVGTSEVINDSLTSADIKNFSLGNGDFLDGSVDSRVVTNDSLTGTDINESTLNLPPTTTATFAGLTSAVPLNDTFTKVTGKTLPAASYAITATSDFRAATGAEAVRDTACELRNGSGFIGGATDRRTFHASDYTTVSLSMNGGAQVPAGGGEVSLWCKVQGGGGIVNSAQMMIIRLDGFF